MVHLRRVFVCLATAICFAFPAYSQSVPASLKPYADDYKAAVQSRDRFAVAEAAYALWQATEDALGDDARTGHMAHVYAKKMSKLPPTKTNTRKMNKAFKRSVSLAAISTDNAFDLDVGRRIDWIEAKVTGAYTEFPDRDIDKLQTRLNDWTTTDTIYHADLKALIALNEANKKGDANAAAVAGLAARRSYKALGKISTQRSLGNYRVLLRSMPSLGDGLLDMALVAQEYAAAAIESRRSYDKIQSIMLYRTADEKLAEADLLSIATAKGFVRPNLEQLLEQAGLDILKVQPMVPHQASTSGYAEVSITVLDDGRVGDVKILSESDTIFGVQAVKAVKKWHYRASTLAPDREPYVEVIKFDLYGNYGQKI